MRLSGLISCKSLEIYCFTFFTQKLRAIAFSFLFQRFESLNNSHWQSWLRNIMWDWRDSTGWRKIQICFQNLFLSFAERPLARIKISLIRESQHLTYRIVGMIKYDKIYGNYQCIMKHKCLSLFIITISLQSIILGD